MKKMVKDLVNMGLWETQKIKLHKLIKNGGYELVGIFTAKELNECQYEIVEFYTDTLLVILVK